MLSQDPKYANAKKKRKSLYPGRDVCVCVFVTIEVNALARAGPVAVALRLSYCFMGFRGDMIVTSRMVEKKC